MKYILVDSFTFEVARAVDRDLSERLGDFSLDADRQRLVTILFVLCASVRQILSRGSWTKSATWRMVTFKMPRNILFRSRCGSRKFRVR